MAQYSLVALKKARKDVVRAFNRQLRTIQKESREAHEVGMRAIRQKMLVNMSDLERMLKNLREIEAAIKECNSIAGIAIEQMNYVP